jgi:hypothetical protein
MIQTKQAHTVDSESAPTSSRKSSLPLSQGQQYLRDRPCDAIQSCDARSLNSTPAHAISVHEATVKNHTVCCRDTVSKQCVFVLEMKLDIRLKSADSSEWRRPTLFQPETKQW